jgi:hypothetical protein
MPSFEMGSRISDDDILMASFITFFSVNKIQWLDIEEQ